MWRRVSDLIRTHIDIIAYAVFGVLTTAVNVVSYWVCSHVLGISTVPASVIAWVLSVAFAFVTNRRWVFHSKAIGARSVLIEALSFFASRFATGVVDWVGMWLLVDVLSLPDVPVKLLVNIVVIVLNYIASKLIVFRH